MTSYNSNLIELILLVYHFPSILNQCLQGDYLALSIRSGTLSSDDRKCYVRKNYFKNSSALEQETVNTQPRPIYVDIVYGKCPKMLQKSTKNFWTPYGALLWITKGDIVKFCSISYTLRLEVANRSCSTIRNHSKSCEANRIKKYPIVTSGKLSNVEIESSADARYTESNRWYGSWTSPGYPSKGKSSTTVRAKYDTSYLTCRRLEGN